MIDESDDATHRSADTRQDRLRAALRENLKRRKSQLRGRAEQATSSGLAADSHEETDE